MPNFSAKDVNKAFVSVRKNGLPSGFGQSTKWDIIDDLTDQTFPPKAILFLAKQIAGDQSHSGGGGDVGTNNALRERGFRVILKSTHEQSPEAEDIEQILSSEEIETTKSQLINARLGQGGFRAQLIELWEGKCAITGLAVSAALRASHIKPWRNADNRERLDPLNGLLLSANVDAIFDRHLISFDDDGRMMVCSTLDRESLIKMGLTEGKAIKINDASKLYLSWHRREFEKNEGNAYFY